MGKAEVLEIIGVDKREKYVRTYVLLSDGTECSGYGEFSVGDPVIYFYDEKWNMIKMLKQDNESLKEKI